MRTCNERIIEGIGGRSPEEERVGAILRRAAAPPFIDVRVKRATTHKRAVFSPQALRTLDLKVRTPKIRIEVVSQSAECGEGVRSAVVGGAAAPCPGGLGVVGLTAWSETVVSPFN